MKIICNIGWSSWRDSDPEHNIVAFFLFHTEYRFPFAYNEQAKEILRGFAAIKKHNCSTVFFFFFLTQPSVSKKRILMTSNCLTTFDI